MGCQKAIAEQVVAQGTDYVLAVKKNQPHPWIILRPPRPHNSKRLSTLPNPGAWVGLRGIGVVETERHQGGRVSWVLRANAPANCNTLRQFALNLLRRARPATSIRQKRLRAAWDDNFRANLVFQQ